MKFRPRRENGKSVLLLEPDYPNKYPPIGLMKLATYHRLQGWRVVFYKGDLSRFVAERLTEFLVHDLSQELPQWNWGRWFGLFCEYVWKGRDAGLKPYISEWADCVVTVLSKLKEFRGKFQTGEYFELHEWDRVLVTTLFTFYADITIETIRFAKRLAAKEIQVGGIMASVVPEYIEKETGIKPSTGILAVPGIFHDKPLSHLIDDLPLDYSILEEIDYRYPAADAFFAHTTRGCPNKCAFCAVPVIEPDYQSYRPLKGKLDYERSMFGDHPNLLLLDNNVFASERFKEIIQEIKDCGFTPGAKISRSDELAICADRVKDGYNPRAYVKKGCAILSEWVRHVAVGQKEIVEKILIENGILGDWHGVTSHTFLDVYRQICPLWEKTRRITEKMVTVDFNQGLDSRLGIKPGTMTVLAQIPVRPVRIAFDHWSLRETYEKSIRAAADAGFRSMSNYILYNFHDTPDELYWRLRLNIALCEELDAPIYSFPMKYHPISDPKYFSNRDYLGEHWCRKYIRFVQLVLNATMGKIGRGKTFFLKAFGETIDEFRELLLMPEYMIRNRLDCEACGETKRWKMSLASLDEDDMVDFRQHIFENDFKVRDEGKCSARLLRLLSFYQQPHWEIPKLTDARRKQMVLEFDEKWEGKSVRLSESDIGKTQETEWFFRI